MKLISEKVWMSYNLSEPREIEVLKDEKGNILYEVTYSEYAALPFINDVQDHGNPGIRYIFAKTKEECQSLLNEKIAYWKQRASSIGDELEFLAHVNLQKILGVKEEDMIPMELVSEELCKENETLRSIIGTMAMALRTGMLYLSNTEVSVNIHFVSHIENFTDGNYKVILQDGTSVETKSEADRIIVSFLWGEECDLGYRQWRPTFIVEQEEEEDEQG